VLRAVVVRLLEAKQPRVHPRAVRPRTRRRVPARPHQALCRARSRVRICRPIQHLRPTHRSTPLPRRMHRSTLPLRRMHRLTRHPRPTRHSTPLLRRMHRLTRHLRRTCQIVTPAPPFRPIHRLRPICQIPSRARMYRRRRRSELALQQFGRWTNHVAALCGSCELSIRQNAAGFLAGPYTHEVELSKRRWHDPCATNEYENVSNHLLAARTSAGAVSPCGIWVVPGAAGRADGTPTRDQRSHHAGQRGFQRYLATTREYLVLQHAHYRHDHGSESCSHYSSGRHGQDRHAESQRGRRRWLRQRSIRRRQFALEPVTTNLLFRTSRADFIPAPGRAD